MVLGKRIPESVQASIHQWLPPAAVALLKRHLGSIHFEGDYARWADAQADCDGYEARVIWERTTEAARAVKRGEAAFERDSVVYKKPAYVWPLLSSLLWAAARHGGSLSVLDFGGSLGSTYFQHRSWLADLARLRWSIVEQPAYVKVGREEFEDESLKFYDDVPSALRAERSRVLLISAVLQYLEAPYAMLEELLNAEFDVILLDRLAFSAENRDKLTVQRVGERIYPASYPAWFFDRRKLVAALERRYRLVQVFQPADRASGGNYYEGLLFERKVGGSDAAE